MTPLLRRPRPVLTGLFISLVVANVFLYQYDSKLNETSRARHDATDTVVQNLPKVLSYNYGALVGYSDAVNKLTTGRFHDEITKFVATTVIPTATAQQIVTGTRIAATSIVSADGDDTVKLLVFLNQTTTKRDAAAPQITGVRVEVVMRKMDKGWLIAELKPV
jgi:Mce-associated membrane protein